MLQQVFIPVCLLVHVLHSLLCIFMLDSMLLTSICGLVYLKEHTRLLTSSVSNTEKP